MVNSKMKEEWRNTKPRLQVSKRDKGNNKKGLKLGLSVNCFEDTKNPRLEDVDFY